MPEFDTILVRPSRVQLLDALLEATRAANTPAAFFDFDNEFWSAFIAEIRPLPEDCRRWREKKYVPGWTWAELAVLWWTDHTGRRHYRVKGDQRKSRDWALVREQAYPLKELYPQRIIFRRLPETAGDWVAVCDCGECGLPTDLAWMGRQCGVCHDRLSEGEKLEPVCRTETIPLDERLRRVRISPDNRRLALVIGPHQFHTNDDHRLILRDLFMGEQVPTPELPTFDDIVFAPDNRVLACTSFNRLIVYDYTTSTIVLDHSEGFQIDQMLFASHAQYLGLIGPEGMQIWEREGREGTWQFALDRPGSYTAIAFSPDGRRVLLGGPSLFVVLAVPTGEVVLDAGVSLPEGFEVHHIVSLDQAGQRWMCILARTDPPGGQGLSIQDARRRECWEIDLGAVEPRFQFRRTFDFDTFEVSPDGRFLIQHEYPGVNIHSFPELHLRGSLQWRGENSSPQVCISPDSRFLITAHASGLVKFWPYRALLGLDSHNPPA